MATSSRRIAPSTDCSASRSCGGTRPSDLPSIGGAVATANRFPTKARLAVLRHDEVDRRVNFTVEVDRDLVLAERFDGVLQRDPMSVDIHLVLLVKRLGDVRRGDRAEGLTFFPDLQADDDRAVVDLVGQALCLFAFLGL